MKTLHMCMLASIALAWALAMPLLADDTDARKEQPGSVVGTALDVNNDALSGVTVVLQGPVPNERRTLVTDDNGFYEFHDVKPGTSYRVVMSAKGYADWTSPVIVLEPGQYKIVKGRNLRLEELKTVINVSYSSEEIATQQLETEKQRVFGIIPNFSTVYDPNPEPLTTKLKFILALKEITDPINGAIVAVLSAPNRRQILPITVRE